MSETIAGIPVVRVEATVLERARVREAASELGEPVHFLIEAADGVGFGEGVSLPEDLGESGRVFGPLGEVRWEGDSALRLRLADASAAPAPATGEGLEEEARERVMPCGGGAEAPGLRDCPWRAVIARRVLSDGADAFVRFVGVEEG